MYSRVFITSRDGKISLDAKKVMHLEVVNQPSDVVVSGMWNVEAVLSKNHSKVLADFVSEQDAIHCMAELVAVLINEDLGLWSWPDCMGDRPAARPTIGGN